MFEVHVSCVKVNLASVGHWHTAMDGNGNTSQNRLAVLTLYFDAIFAHQFQGVILGYCFLIYGVFIAIINSVLLFTFWRKELNNTTHIFVAAICVSETLFVLTSGVGHTYVVFIINSRESGNIIADFCSTIHFVDLVSKLFLHHSIFLTVALATQRCVCVRCPLIFSSIFTKKRTVLCVIGLFIFAILINVFDITTYTLVDFPMVGVEENSDDMSPERCRVARAEWIMDDTFQKMYLINIVVVFVCVGLIPNICLLTAGILLVSGLRNSIALRKTACYRINNGQFKRERKLTFITCWIIAAFLFFQTPKSVVDGILAYYILNRKFIDSSVILAMIITLGNVILTLPSNFIIYIVCYKECYQYLRSICTCTKGRMVVAKSTNQQTTESLSIEDKTDE